MFADFEIAGFHLFLRSFDLPGNELALDRNPFLHPKRLHDPRDAVTGEDAHEVVFQRKIKTRRARIALASSSAAQLIVDPARFVPLGSEDMQAPERHHLIVFFRADGGPLLLYPIVVDLGNARGVDSLLTQRLKRKKLRVPAQEDVGSAAGHVGCDGHRFLSARLGNNLGLFGVVLCVQHHMRDGLALEQRAQLFRLFNRNRPDQYGAIGLVEILDLVDHCVVLLPFSPIDHVRILGADQGLVGRNAHDFEFVDLVKFLSFGLRRAGHAGQF